MSEKERVVSFEEVFLNSKSIFVEYVDLIKPTYYPLIQFMSKKETDDTIYDLSKIHGLNNEELGDWYVGRKHQNPLLDLVKEDMRDLYPSKVMDELLDTQIKEVPELIKMSPIFNMGQCLLKLFESDNYLVNKFYIWYPFNNMEVFNDINTTLEPIMKYGEILTGNIVDALNNVPEDSTYVFSDVTNVLALQSIGKLPYSSIIIPQEYGYNAEEGHYIIDFEELRKECVFKLDEFYATE